MRNLITKSDLTIVTMIVMVMMSVKISAQERLTLSQCREQALEHNRRIRIAEREAEATAFVKRAAFTQYLPSISINGGYMRTNRELQPLSHDLFLPIVPFNTIDPATGNFNPKALLDPATALKTLVINPKTGMPLLDASGNPVFQQYAMIPADKMKIDQKNLYFAKLSITQPIFTGFKITEANKIAEYTAAIAKEKITLTKAEVLSKTDEAYWRVVSLQEKVKLANSYNTLIDRLVSDLQNIYEEGIITKSDLLKAQVKQNEGRLKLLKAENGLALSKMALSQIIGAESDQMTIADSSLTIEGIYALTYSSKPISANNRAEIAMLQQKLNIARSGKALAISRFLPEVAISGGYGVLSPNPYNGMKREFGGDWSVGVVCSIPIFHWGEKLFITKAAKRMEESAKYELEEAKEMIELQIRQAQYKYSEAVKRSELTKLSKQQAEENMEMTRENFSEGRLKLSDLLEAQLQWELASSEHIDSMIEAKIALSELEKATGEIYNRYSEINKPYKSN